MHRPHSALAIAAAAGLALAASAHAQVWNETGDAGELPSTAQPAAGAGPLDFIFGSLDTPDSVDMFQIEICDPFNFSASTVGQTTFDTILYLFDHSGMGIAMNDDSSGVLQSTITSQFIPGPGLYFIAIARYNRQAVSPGGRIFDPPAFNIETGPNGPGGAQPVSGWINPTIAAGAYSIILTGACMVDENTPGACCLVDGTCIASTLGGCAAQSGTFGGANSDCATTNCDPGGACCLQHGACSLLTSAACASQGGIWNGAGTTCGGIACMGACCLPDGTCTVITPHSCAAQTGSTYLGDGSQCTSCSAISFLPLPLTCNWNGLVSPDVEQGPANFNNPDGYRSVADRGLLLSGGGVTFNAINAAPLLGTDDMPYDIIESPGALDIVHLGDRRTVANSARTWGTGGNNALQPAWLIDNDHTVPQVTELGTFDATLTAQSRLGFIYQISDFGGRFDVLLTFTDSSTALLTLRAPDWFNVQTVPPPLPGSGLIVQRMLGPFASTQDTDNANNTTNNLNVVEAVTSVQRLREDGFGDFTGKRLASISFQNPVSNANYPNSTPATGSGIAILAATLSYPGGAGFCYANCDASTVQPILNVDDFTCFINEFAASQGLPHAQQVTAYANCDASTVPPALNVDDFTCFINAFAQGCR